MKPMRSNALVVVLILAVVAAALYFTGVLKFDSPAPSPATPPAAVPEQPKPLPELGAAEPTTEPKPEVPEVVTPIRVLVLGQKPRSYVEWLFPMFDYVQKIDWQVWYSDGANPGGRTHSDALPALDKAPLGADLEQVGVLVLAGVDPAKLSPEFWSSVADRVRSGRLGLLMVTENQFAKAQADEPSLKSILPITGAKAVGPTSVGSREIAGVYEKEKSFVVTEDGTKHPASRMVPYAGWSKRLWEAQSRGKGAWKTKFVAPVTGVAPGARVLANVDVGGAEVPAIVASGGTGGRTLWVAGLFDVGNGAYSDSDSFDRMRALVISWIVWLAEPRS